MRRPDARGGLLLSAALVGLAGCSEQTQPAPPTEQEIHANDRGVAGDRSTGIPIAATTVNRCSSTSGTRACKSSCATPPMARRSS